MLKWTICLGMGIGLIWGWAIIRPSVAEGVEGEKLAHCPSSPNCVCTEYPEEQGYLPPLPTLGHPRPLEVAREVILQLPRFQLKELDAHYLHAEARTKWLRFVDDVEIRWDEENGLLHFRSASRIGYSDLGTNRRRVQALMKTIAERLTSSS